MYLSWSLILSISKKANIAAIIIYLLGHIPTFEYGLLKMIGQSKNSEMISRLTYESIQNIQVVLPIAQFLLVFIAVSILFVALTANFSKIFTQSKIASYYIRSENIRILASVLTLNVCIFILNAIFFDHSDYLGKQLSLWSEHHLFTKTTFALLFISLFIGWFVTLGSRLWAILSLSIAALFVAHNITKQNNNVPSSDLSHPNIIVVGIDSLRSDLLWSHMPFLSEQLKKSEIFPLAYTELGRTFPAWNTILTGQYPVSHGARINLTARSEIVDENHYLSTQLQKLGYKTIFAYDETRFANFDKSYGFDQVISPKMGASDFIIGQIYDLPLINLLSLLDISQWLLPELYANRAADKIYRTKSFNNLIDHNLPAAMQPTFIATHFCLPHWPYSFSNSYFHPDDRYPVPFYPANLQAVDKQIENYFDTLRVKGYLDNAIIVFLSDHGEAWDHEAPLFHSYEERRSFTRSTNGHGSDLVTESANRILIAFQFQNHSVPESNLNEMVSLADIGPTLASLIGTELPHADGENLVSPKLTLDRWIPIETGTVFDLEQLDKANIMDSIAPFLDRYEISKSGKVQIKPAEMSKALAHKRYGVRNSQYVLTKEKDAYYLFNTTSNTFSSATALKEIPEISAIKAWCKWYENEECDANVNW